MLPVVAVVVVLAAMLARQNMSGHDSKRTISTVLLWLLEDSSKEKVIITNCSGVSVDSHSEISREIPRSLREETAAESCI